MRKECVEEGCCEEKKCIYEEETLSARSIGRKMLMKLRQACQMQKEEDRRGG